MSQRRENLAIIGPGKVGTAVGILAARAGYHVVVGARCPECAEEAAEQIAPGTPAMPSAEAAAEARLCLLTVSDDAIEPVCHWLVGAGALRPGVIVAHCSGALGSEILAPAREAGCPVGSMHPLQTFPSASAAIRTLPGTYIFCEGDDEAVEVLQTLAGDIGGQPRRIGPAGKALYHAAAVVACNYLSGLMDAALTLAEGAGIDRKTAWPAMEPLVRATVDNIAATGPADALTGPIARGDTATVQRHLAALAGTDADLAALYRAAGRWTVGLAERKGTLPPDKAEQLRRLLETAQSRV